MNDTDPPQEALATRDKLSTLSAQMYRAIEHGIALALDFFAKDGREPDPWLFSHIVRFGALEQLPSSALSIQGEYSLTRNPMCGIEIHLFPWTIRVWKKPNEEEELLQPPGESVRRQDFFDQKQRIFPGTEHLFKDMENLVYVWDRLKSGGVDLWLVKPLGFEHIWKAGNHKWKIRIEHPATQVVPTADFSELENDEPLDIQLDETGSGDDPEDGA